MFLNNGENNTQSELQRGSIDNNLELYLNDVYDKECAFKGEPEVVKFVQIEIETLVDKIVERTLDIFSTDKNMFCGSSVKEQKLITETDRYFKESIVEFYFPVKRGSRFLHYKGIKSAKSSIIKVGSFFEGTKNNFPVEFDFIFLVFCAREKLNFFAWVELTDAVASCITKVLKTITLHIASSHSKHGTREIYYNTKEKFFKSHGSAAMLEFIYKDCSGHKTYIHVDLVPGYSITVHNNPDWYVHHMNQFVKPKTFRTMILASDRCFVIGDTISFTETEVHFIRNILSENRSKVYRILKCLINGLDNDDELMRKCLIDKSLLIDYKPYSSYMVKSMMIYHHDECRNAETTSIGPCVIQVLDEMCKHQKKGEFPAFAVYRGTHGDCLVNYIQSEVERLHSIQIDREAYRYDRYKMKSVTKRFLEAEHLDSLEKVYSSQHLEKDKHVEPSFLSMSGLIDAVIKLCCLINDILAV